jgi:hypothetical protein
VSEIEELEEFENPLPRRHRVSTKLLRGGRAFAKRAKRRGPLWLRQLTAAKRRRRKQGKRT